MTISEEERQRLLGESDDAKVSYPKFQRSGLVASLLGMLAGLGMLVLVSVTLAAGAILLALEFDVTRPVEGVREMSLLGIGVAAVVLLVATLVGGFVAGRTARHGGILTGLGSSLWLALVLLVFTGLTLLIGTVSATFDGFGLADQLSLFGSENLMMAAAIAGGGLFVLGLLGGLVGGRLGETREQDSRLVVDVRGVEANQEIEAGEAEPDKTRTEEAETADHQEQPKVGEHEAGSREPVFSHHQSPPTTGL